MAKKFTIDDLDQIIIEGFDRIRKRRQPSPTGIPLPNMGQLSKPLRLPPFSKIPREKI